MLLAAHLLLHLLELLKLLELLELDELLILIWRYEWIWELRLWVRRNLLLVVHLVHVELILSPLIVQVLIKLRWYAILHVHIVGGVLRLLFRLFRLVRGGLAAL